MRDVVPERIADLEAGRVPIFEPELEELIAKNRERMSFTLSIEDVFADARIAFVCVGTPSTYSGDADLTAIWHVLDELPAFEERALLVMKSTVPVGTGEKVRHELDMRGLAHVGYVSNPEFLAEGTAVKNFMNPDRVAVGAFADADGDAVAALYEPLGAPIVRTDVASAEMIKLASNAFLMTRISFINEIANVCELVGADVARVAEGVGLDHRLGPHFLRAGIGYGGSCFPKDSLALKQLAANSGYHFQLLSAVIEVNELQKRRVVAKLVKHLGALQGKTVALLGLSFKPNTDDLREAPSLVLGVAPPGRGCHRARLGSRCDARGGEAPLRSRALCVLRGCGRRRRCRRDRDRVGAAQGSGLSGDAGRDAEPADRGRPQHVRSRDGPRRRVHVRGDRARCVAVPPRARNRRARPEPPGLMEALILAGGKAERLGDAAHGLPKPLVPVAGKPLVAHTLARLPIDRAILACAAGHETEFEEALAGVGPEIVAVGEPEPLGRGGGLRLAASVRKESGPVFALNGDEVLDLDFAALLRFHEDSGAAATLVVCPLVSQFGVVELDGDRVTGFTESPKLPHWVNAGLYVLGRGSAGAAAGARRPRAVDVPGAGRGGPSRRIPPRRPVADREHAEGSAPRRGGARGGDGVVTDSPNLLDLDRFSADVTRVEKPWGYEIIFAHTEHYVGKLLFVRAGEQLSLQFHKEKDETIYVHEGKIELEIGEPGGPLDTEIVGPGHSFRIKPGTVHRWRALEDSAVLEASTPQLDDVVRLEDRYGRADA